MKILVDQPMNTLLMHIIVWERSTEGEENLWLDNYNSAECSEKHVWSCGIWPFHSPLVEDGCAEKSDMFRQYCTIVDISGFYWQVEGDHVATSANRFLTEKMKRLLAYDNNWFVFFLLLVMLMPSKVENRWRISNCLGLACPNC